MRLPMVFDGKVWRKATMKEYKQALINVPVYGTANFLFRDVWELPTVDTNSLTGSKVVGCECSVQFRFSCARSTEAAQIARAYKLGLDRDARAGVKFNYTKVGATFNFETTFCGSASALKKFLKRLEGVSSIKSLYVRFRDETTGEVSSFKKFEYNNLTLNIVRYLRDNLTIKDYNNLNIKKMEVTPSNNRWGVIVTL